MGEILDRVASDRELWWGWSAIPDPERALIAAEEPEPGAGQDFAGADQGELAQALAVVRPVDLEIFYLYEVAGLDQTTIGARIGMAQPSVSSRMIGLRRWLELVVPLRAEVRRRLGGEEVPPGLSELDATIFDHVFWQHVNQSTVGMRIGRTQGFVRHRYLRIWRGCRELAGLVPPRQHRWYVPPERPHLRGPVVRRSRVQVSPIDPQLSDLLAALDEADRRRRWERDFIRLLDGLAHPVGIDLAEKHEDVRRLALKFAGPTCHARGWSFEDFLSELYVKISVLNRGTWAYDASKGAFGHYVVIVIRGLLARQWHHGRARMRIPCEQQVAIDDPECALQLPDGVAYEAALDLDRVREEDPASFDELVELGGRVNAKVKAMRSGKGAEREFLSFRKGQMIAALR